MGTDTKRERPILFSGPMIPPILADDKTQTRRVMLPQPPYVPTSCVWLDCNVEPEKQRYGFWQDDRAWACPYGGPGQRLYVKETYGVSWADGALVDPVLNYRSDGEQIPIRPETDLFDSWRECWMQPRKRLWNPRHWRSGRFMPRWASRIDLEETEVRAERVQDISGNDALAEGVDLSRELFRGINAPDKALRLFPHLWDSINAKPKPLYEQKKIISYVSYPWEGEPETREHRGLPWVIVPNPGVWVVGFRRMVKELPKR